VDEAGRGPLAGPVVAGAVVLHRHDFRVALDDSKRLTPLARERAYEAILRSAHIGVGAVGPEEIDRIGIQAATHRAMQLAIRRLGILPELVLVDGLHLPPGCGPAMKAVVRGDSRSLAIACASIVAKVTRDRWMRWVHRLHPEYGFARHKGYGTAQHMEALEAFGPGPFHRYTFHPVSGSPGSGVL